MSKTAHKDSTAYGKLTRADLPHFSSELQTFVLSLLELEGVQARLASGNGHVILRGPSGRTMWISRNNKTGYVRIEKVISDAKGILAPAQFATLEDIVNVMKGRPAKKAAQTPVQPHTVSRTTSEMPSQIDAKPPVLDFTIKPFMKQANKRVDGTFQMVESDTIEVIEWADGTVKHKCKFCDYARDSYKSIIPHLGRAHKAETAALKTAKSRPAPTPENIRTAEDAYDGPGTHMPPAPANHGLPPAPVSVKGVVACPEEIAEPERNSGMNAEHDYAEWAAAQADTPAWTDPRIQKIRDLLGTDPRVAELEAEVERLQFDLLEAEDRAAHCAAETAEVRSNLEALKGMISSI